MAQQIKTIMKISQKFLKKIGIYLFLILISFNVFFAIYAQKEKYTIFTFWQNFPQLKQSYLDSQYVNKHPKGWIPDEVVNSYAGGAYVQGVSPILIAPDTPPLGRYLIGLSAILFNNVNFQNVFFAIGALVMLYKVGQQIFKDTFFSLLPLVIFSFEPLYTNQFIYSPLLDIIQLFFLLCAFYFFNKIFFKKQNVWKIFLFANFFLGCFIATKFYATGITVTAAWIATLLILRRYRDCLTLLLTSFMAVFVLLLSYVRVLFENYSLLKFLGIQKYVFFYHKSQLIHTFSIWSLLLLNKWYVWFGDKPVISDAQWRLTWPAATIITLVAPFVIFIKKHFNPILPLVLWVLCYLLFFSVGQVASRYFIILLPIMYLIAVYTVREVVLMLPKK